MDLNTIARVENLSELKLAEMRGEHSKNYRVLRVAVLRFFDGSF